MSYDVPSKKYPIAADVDALATFLAQRMSDSGTTNGGIVATPPSPSVQQMGVDAAGLGLAYLKGMADGFLCASAYQGQSDAAGLGTAFTSSTSFVDVGNGSSTGFASWTFSVAIAKTYLLGVRNSCYVTTAGGLVMFQVLVDGSAPGGQPSSAQRFYFNSINQQNVFVYDVPVSLTAGSHIFKLQWKVTSGVVAQVDVNDGRTMTLKAA